MKLTKKQIAGIARKTKQVCAENGQGSTVQVYPDASYTEAPSANPVGAGVSYDGTTGEVWPVAIFRFPQTREQIADTASWPVR